jgi:TPP-dependent pyruvate/acetoin dehydrogenase alpha subunit
LLTGETDLAMAWDDSLIPDEHRLWHAEQDAVLRFVREILAAKIIDKDAILAMDSAVRREMKAGVEFALESDYPPAAAAMEKALA